MAKLGVSSIAAVVSLGICVAVKMDKKIAGAVAATSFIASYLAQK